MSRLLPRTPLNPIEVTTGDPFNVTSSPMTRPQFPTRRPSLLRQPLREAELPVTLLVFERAKGPRGCRIFYQLRVSIHRPDRLKHKPKTAEPRHSLRTVERQDTIGYPRLLRSSLHEGYVIKTWHSAPTSISWQRRSSATPARQTAQTGHAPAVPDAPYQTQLDCQQPISHLFLS